LSFVFSFVVALPHRQSSCRIACCAANKPETYQELRLGHGCQRNRTPLMKMVSQKASFLALFSIGHLHVVNYTRADLYILEY